MKILHVCLSSHYTEGMTYQDNQLPDQNAKDGHNVVVVSDCYIHEGSDLTKVEEEYKVMPSGVRLVRMNYDYIFSHLASSKIRKVKKLYNFIADEKPDVILFHGVAGYEMLTVAKYKKKNPKTKLYIDSHEDFHNSGTFWLSKTLQYKIFNRFIVNKIKNKVDKFLYVSYESKDFLEKMYGLEDSKLEFYPLGGNIVEKDNKKKFSQQIRAQYGYKQDDILVLHSGKLVPAKKTKELITAFKSVTNPRLKLIILGSIPTEYSQILNKLIQSDERINFVGWKTSTEVIEYLCAADIYFQPGTQSATMQNAICCGTPVALYPYSSHKPYINNNGFFVSNKDDYIRVFEFILSDPESLTNMSEASYNIARDLLDYKLIASRLYR